MGQKFCIPIKINIYNDSTMSSKFIPKFHGGDATCHNRQKDAMTCSALLSALAVFILTHPLCHYLGCVEVEKNYAPAQK